MKLALFVILLNFAEPRLGLGGTAAHVKRFSRSFVSPSQLERHQRLFAPTPVCPGIIWNLPQTANTSKREGVTQHPSAQFGGFTETLAGDDRGSSLGNMMSQTVLMSAFDALIAASLSRYNAATQRLSRKHLGQTDSRHPTGVASLPVPLHSRLWHPADAEANVGLLG